MWFVTRSQTWRRWWRVSRIMQQPCSNHILCGQVLPLVLMPQNSRTTMTSGRKSTPSLNVTRYLEEEMMSNSQLTCLESIFQSWQRGPLTSESPFFKIQSPALSARQGLLIEPCTGYPSALELTSGCAAVAGGYPAAEHLWIWQQISDFCRDLFSHLHGSKFLFSRGKWN